MVDVLANPQSTMQYPDSNAGIRTTTDPPELKGLVDFRGKKISEIEFAKKVVEHYKAAKNPLAEMHDLMRVVDEYYRAEFWNEKKRPSWRLSPATNFIYKMVAQIKAQVNKNDITPVFKTSLTQFADQVKELEQIVADVADNRDLEEAKDPMIEAGVLLSTGHIKVTWDNTLSGGSEQGKNLWVGNVRYTEIDPTNCYPDPKSYEVQPCRYFIVAAPKTIEYIKEKPEWAKKAADIQPDALSSDVKIYTRPNTDGQNDEVLLLEYWWKYKGEINVAYVVGDTVLQIIYNVYRDGKYPFVKFTPKPLRKSYWGMMLPKQIKGNQEAHNKLIEMMLVNAMLTANQQKLYDPNKVDGAKITNEPGLKIPVKTSNGDLRAAYLPVETPSIPSYVQNLAGMFKDDIKDIGLIYEAATGETPGAVTAASAIAMLAEQASIPIEDINKQLFKTMEEIYEMTASRVTEFSQETRHMTTKQTQAIIDPTTGAEVQKEVEVPVSYIGTDYAELDYMVTVQAVKGNPLSKAYAAEQARQLYNDKVINAEIYLESIDFPLKDKALEWIKQQEAQAQQIARAEAQAKLQAQMGGGGMNGQENPQSANIGQYAQANG